jgi:hypothetical protein
MPERSNAEISRSVVAVIRDRGGGGGTRPRSLPERLSTQCRVVIGPMADRGHADADQIVGGELPACGRQGPVLWSPSSVTLPAKASPLRLQPRNLLLSQTRWQSKRDFEPLVPHAEAGGTVERAVLKTVVPLAGDRETLWHELS